MDLKPLIRNLRKRIEQDHFEFDSTYSLLKDLDDFINSSIYSDLEKSFYLFLNQFPSDHKNYSIHPREMVLIKDIYDISVPGIEYEIDFALYGGSINNPVKVAIECDGIRSHGHKQSKRDRRKDVNLQAEGWIVIRFTSKEIHEELFKFRDDNNYISVFLLSIENVISEKLKLISGNSYMQYRSQLTGYNYGDIKCTLCLKSQYGILNRKKHICVNCKEKFIREIGLEERVIYEHNGLLFFDKSN